MKYEKVAIFGCTPLHKSSVAHVCRRSCQRISGKPACLKSGLKPVYGVLGFERRPLRVSEHEAVILPHETRPELFFYLALAVLPERLDGAGWKTHDAVAGVLRSEDS